MSKKNRQPAGLAERLVAYGRKQGASRDRGDHRGGPECSVFVFEGEVQNLTEAGSRTVNLRVFVDGKAANASSSDLADDPRAARGRRHRPRQAGRPGPVRRAAGQPSRPKAKADELAIYDPAIAEVTNREAHRAARQASRRSASADKRVNKSMGGTVGTRDGSRTLVNSKGSPARSGAARSSATSGSRPARGQPPPGLLGRRDPAPRRPRGARGDRQEGRGAHGAAHRRPHGADPEGADGDRAVR